MLESLSNNVAGVQACNFIKNILLHCFPMKFLRAPILKNICERLILFVAPQNTLINRGGKFGLDETSTECNVFFKRNNFIQSNAAI